MKRVAVLRGGPSREHAISLQTGKAVLSALNDISYPTRDVFITKQGEWLDGGITRRPDQVLEGIDVVFLALHGEYGEDGQVQNLIHRHGVPYTGSRSFPSAFAFNKTLTKNRLSEYGIRSPKSCTVLPGQLPTKAELQAITKHEQFFVKPARGGSSVSAQIVEGIPELLELLSTVATEPFLIEELILGREATVGVIEGLRDEQLYVLPVVEIIPPTADRFFTFENKYSGATEEICPGRFSNQERAELQKIARLVHQTLDLQQYSRSDFILKDGDIYFLEVNTLPGLTAESLFPKAAKAVGVEFQHLVKHLVDTARC